MAHTVRTAGPLTGVTRRATPGQGNASTSGGRFGIIARLVKAACVAGAPAADVAAVAELRKLLVGAVDERIATVLTKASATAEDLTKVAARIAKVEHTLATSGPVQARTRADLARSEEADRLDVLAAGCIDPHLAQGYRDLAERTRSEPTKGPHR